MASASEEYKVDLASCALAEGADANLTSLANQDMSWSTLEYLWLACLVSLLACCTRVALYRGTDASGTLHSRIMPSGYDAKNEKEKDTILRYEEKQQIESWLRWYWMNCNVVTAALTTGLHLTAFYGATLLQSCSTATIVWTTVCWFLSCLGITAGSHRLWSHKSYEAALPFRFFIMILASLANQGTIFHWVRDHRVHHRYSETKADPHNALRGLFFSHIGWLYVKKDPRVILAGQKIDMSDIEHLPEIVLQRRLFPFWNLFWCFGFPTIVSHVAFGASWEIGFFVPGCLRYVVVLHSTFLVNSAAHYFGDRPYEEINPTENPLVAFFSIGEGWHNYHHAYPFDYAASELGVSSQYNPTKFVIDIAAGLGLVWNRRRAVRQCKSRILRKGFSSSLEGYPLFKIRQFTAAEE